MDDELIEAMWRAYSLHATPKPFEVTTAMRAVLAVVRAHDRDGERYRYVRQNPLAFGTAAWRELLPLTEHYTVTPERLDAAIDAAMRGEG